MFTTDPVIISISLSKGSPVLITLWTFIGFLGNNVLFTARSLIQWIASERARQSVAPKAYWWTSLTAAIIMILYSLQRATDPKFANNPTALPFLIGYLITLVPYIRNLMLSYNLPRRWHILSYIFSACVFLLCMGLLARIRLPIIRSRWFFVGMTGSLIWYTRFLWQWFYAEREKRSAFPISFWYLSLTGATLNTLYSVLMRDIVFILGFIFTAVPITRNIILMKRNRKAEER